jgi:hypothetical protein
MSLRVYTVHTPPTMASRRPTKRWEALDPLPELVKEGFSWPAFFFGIVWALYQRLWLVAAGLVVIGAGLSVAFEELHLDPVSMSLTFFAISVLTGLFGNDWRRAALRRRGYGEDGVVTAANLETALRRYLDLRAIGGSALRAAPAPQSWQTPDAGPWGPSKL